MISNVPAHIKDSVSGGWFECNDDCIEKIDRKGYSKKLVMNDEGEGIETNCVSASVPY